jgi:hypothetical protein
MRIDNNITWDTLNLLVERKNFDSAFKLIVGIKGLKDELRLMTTVIEEINSKVNKNHYNGHMSNETTCSNVMENLLMLPCARRGLLLCDYYRMRKQINKCLV